MKKVALVFVLAVLAPSLVLAWLAVRSLRDQQFLLERQQSQLDQRVTDTLAQNIAGYLSQQQQEFSIQVEGLAAAGNVQTLTTQFDDQLRRRWPLAEVGFCVTASGKIMSPPPNASPAAQMFRLDNGGFLGNREPVEVYWSANNFNASLNGGNNLANNGWSFGRGQANQSSLGLNENAANPLAQPPPQRQLGGAGETTLADNSAPQSGQQPEAAGNPNSPAPVTGGGTQKAIGLDESTSKDVPIQSPYQSTFNYKAAQSRKVSPQSQIYQYAEKTKAEGAADDAQNNLSKVVPAEAEFRQLIGDQSDGMLARFLQNKLKLMCWHRLRANPDLIFGAQLNLDRVVDGLRGMLQPDRSSGDELCLAILDDNARPVVVSRGNFQANWRRPFVATEVGDALPHWEAAAYLVNPAQLTQAAHTAKLTLGLLITVLVIAIGTGSLLIVRSLDAELKLARQKTDFVGNVSHELKTPLTSIRMFSELLAEGRVADPAKQRSYLQIITTEAARLTRLINNVLDFSRMERGEKKYSFQPCDLTDIVRSTAETYRPHLESSGFKFDCEMPAVRIPIRGDADALSQIIVNLLSNAEKYSNGGKEIALQLAQKQLPLPHAEIRVLDRGPGLPRGCEEKVFEKFYRAHDSLSSGIQGSGLGLTIARQIARAHSGDIVYEPRDGGGSCFSLRLPVQSS